MLLTAIYAILKKAEPYNPNLYRNESASTAPTSKVLSVEQAFAFIQRQGYIVVDPDGELVS